MSVSVLGKYEVRGVLGRGAMGTVYDGWDPVIARRVAIKAVSVSDLADPEAQEQLARFRQEAQAAGRLHHPNVVGVFDIGEAATDFGEAAYIVMEFVEGRSLAMVLEGSERLPLIQVRHVMQGLLRGLQYSHGRGVIHRDIKPANLILTKDNEIKIADFGIARIESSSLTQAGTVMGTPAYMSPEQFRGEPPDLRTDIYSAGVLLYELLTGKRPFVGSFASIMHKALHAEPPSVTALATSTPMTLDKVVARAMAKRPIDRYPDADAFLAALLTALEMPAASLPKGTVTDATVLQRPPVSRRSGTVLLAGAGLAVLVLAGGSWAVLSFRVPVLTPNRRPAVSTLPAAREALPQTPAAPGPASIGRPNSVVPRPPSIHGSTSVAGAAIVPTAPETGGKTAQTDLLPSTAPVASDQAAPGLAGHPAIAADSAAGAISADLAVQRAKTASGLGHFAEAAQWLQRAADQGNAEAQNDLGAFYGSGRGVPRDDAVAMRWYQRAADQGDAEAQYNLGALYEDGQGVRQDYAEAARWYRRAADLGDADAQYNLGVFFLNGQGVPRDDAEGMRLLRRAADQGDADAQNAIGTLYVSGQGVPPNNAEAMLWYRRAADRGNADAQYDIGVLYENGRGVPRDYGQAMRWYSRAADQGDADALYAVGTLHARGRGVPRSQDQALRWFRKAAAAGNAAAQALVDRLGG